MYDYIDKKYCEKEKGLSPLKKKWDSSFITPVSGPLHLLLPPKVFLSDIALACVFSSFRLPFKSHYLKDSKSSSEGRSLAESPAPWIVPGTGYAQSAERLLLRLSQNSLSYWYYITIIIIHNNVVISKVIVNQYS